MKLLEILSLKETVCESLRVPALVLPLFAGALSSWTRRRQLDLGRHLALSSAPRGFGCLKLIKKSTILCNRGRLICSSCLLATRLGWKEQKAVTAAVICWDLGSPTLLHPQPLPAGGILQVAPVLAQKLCFNDLLTIYEKTEMIRQEEGKTNGCFGLGSTGRWLCVVRRLGASRDRAQSQLNRPQQEKNGNIS